MRITSISLALAMGGMAIPAVAAEQATATVRVDYKDLDLASKAGRDELERRLDRAARSVCGTAEATTGTRLSSQTTRQCLREVRANLDRQFAAMLGGQSQG